MPYIEWEHKVYKDDPEKNKKAANEAAGTALTYYILGYIFILVVLFGAMALLLWDVLPILKIFVIAVILISALLCVAVIKLSNSRKPLRLFTTKEDKVLLYNKIWQTNDAVIYCHKCGEKMSKDSDFCCKCGVKLKQNNF